MWYTPLDCELYSRCHFPCDTVIFSHPDAKATFTSPDSEPTASQLVSESVHKHSLPAAALLALQPHLYLCLMVSVSKSISSCISFMHLFGSPFRIPSVNHTTYSPHCWAFFRILHLHLTQFCFLPKSCHSSFFFLVFILLLN